MIYVLPIVLTPATVWLVVSAITFCLRHRQLRKDTKMLLKNGVKHALVTNDQILF